MRHPHVALVGAVISTVLSTVQVVVAIGLAVITAKGNLGGGALLATALIGGVGLVGTAAGVGAMRMRRGALLASAGIQLAWAVLIAGGVLVAGASHLSAATHDLLVLFTIPAGAAAIAGALCGIGLRR